MPIHKGPPGRGSTRPLVQPRPVGVSCGAPRWRWMPSGQLHGALRPSSHCALLALHGLEPAEHSAGATASASIVKVKRDR